MRLSCTILCGSERFELICDYRTYPLSFAEKCTPASRSHRKTFSALPVVRRLTLADSRKICLSINVAWCPPITTMASGATSFTACATAKAEFIVGVIVVISTTSGLKPPISVFNCSQFIFRVGQPTILTSWEQRSRTAARYARPIGEEGWCRKTSSGIGGFIKATLAVLFAFLSANARVYSRLLRIYACILKEQFQRIRECEQKNRNLVFRLYLGEIAYTYSLRKTMWSR